ncbi:hypothetical protein PPYR_09019 [Photinus pyralis]|uniref:Lipid-binding serum glycoprotein N-terminal domain-containing protein n=1 Tax=Photinus pyralis TaxID=7054 RepID=A0A5N4AL45_PHOPY|nr:uncharacterized protein LOC116172511 [Photinus pyralis]KAB0798026.1 hypothetical protein PPYR_09019 [Photinus pyralis]
MKLIILCFLAAPLAVVGSNLIQPRSLEFETFDFKHLGSKDDFVQLQGLSTREQVAVINDYMDVFLVELNGFIAEQGMDSMKLDDVGGKFGWTIFTGEMSLTNGIVKGLNSVARGGDVTLRYENTVLKASLPIKLENVNLNYNYAVKLMNLGPHGLLNGTVKGCRVLLQVQIDLDTLLAKLDLYKLETLGDISLKFQGGILEWMVNLFVSVAIPLIKPVLNWAINTFTQGTVAGLIVKYNDVITKLLESLNNM